MNLNLDPKDGRHKSLARLIIARSDIKKACEAAKLVVRRIASMRDELFDPLSCATVIWYSRPFVQARTYPGIPQRYSEKFPRGSFKKIHDLLVEHRNRFEAHRDKEFNEVSLVHKDARIEFVDGNSVDALCSHGEFISSNYIKLEAFPYLIELFDFQLDRLESNINSEKERLFP